MRTIAQILALITKETDDRKAALDAIFAVLPKDPNYRVNAQAQKVMHRYFKAHDPINLLRKERRDLAPDDAEGIAKAKADGFSFQCLIGPNLNELKNIDADLHAEIMTRNVAYNNQRAKIKALEYEIRRLALSSRPINEETTR